MCVCECVRNLLRSPSDLQLIATYIYVYIVPTHLFIQLICLLCVNIAMPVCHLELKDRIAADLINASKLSCICKQLSKKSINMYLYAFICLYAR